MGRLEDYFVIEKVGSGGFGTVYKGYHKDNGEIVAIKVLNQKFNSWEECISVPEVYVASIMKHENIIQLKDVIWNRDLKNLCLVSEYMEGSDLYKIMAKKQQPFPEAQGKKWCSQILQGLAHVHSCGFIHGDIKPENLLLSNDNNAKIVDFGLTLNINSQNVEGNLNGILNYMAPEILLGSRNYGYAIDMWAMGATMAELLGFHALFLGTNAYDQLAIICGVIGNPNVGEWDEGVELARILNYEFPEVAGAGVRRFIPSASEDAIDVIKKLCCWDPKRGQVLYKYLSIVSSTMSNSSTAVAPCNYYNGPTAFDSRNFPVISMM